MVRDPKPRIVTPTTVSMVCITIAEVASIVGYTAWHLVTRRCAERRTEQLYRGAAIHWTFSRPANNRRPLEQPRGPLLLEFIACCLLLLLQTRNLWVRLLTSSPRQALYQKKHPSITHYHMPTTSPNMSHSLRQRAPRACSAIDRGLRRPRL
jgi:hypothetical protein